MDVFVGFFSEGEINIPGGTSHFISLWYLAADAATMSAGEDCFLWVVGGHSQIRSSQPNE